MRSSAALVWIAVVWWLAPGGAEACQPELTVAEADFVFESSSNVDRMSPHPPSSNFPWRSVALPDAMGSRLQGSTGISWYRFSFHASPGAAVCGLYISRLQSSAVIYLNSSWVAQTGRFIEPSGNVWNYPFYAAFSDDRLVDGANVLEMGVLSRGARADGIGRVVIGLDSELRSRYERSLFWRVRVAEASTVVGAVLCLIFAALFGALRMQIYFWFCLATGLYGLTSLNWHLREPPLDFWAFTTLINVAVQWMCCCMGITAIEISGLPARWIERPVALWAVVLLAMALVMGGRTYEALQGALLPISMTVPVVGFIFLIRARHQMIRAERRILLITGAAAIGLGIHDVYLEGMKFLNRIDPEKVYFYPYVGLALVVGFGAVLFGRFLRAQRTAEAANLDLTAKVAEKHAELERNFAQLRDLERNQAIALERERLIREMHDGVGGQLVALLTTVDRGDPQRSEIAEALREALDDMRLVIHSLDPGAESIPAMLASMRTRWEPRLRSHGVRFRWVVQDLPELPRLRASEVLHVLRIVQESITNAIKHAGAHALTVSTGTSQSMPLRIFVEVADDGKGIGSQCSEGRGLRNLHARAQLLGGAIEIASDETGTRVRLWIPVERWT